MDQNDNTPLSSAQLLGIEFIEILAPSVDSVMPLLTQLGFVLTAKHRRKDVFLFRQNQLKIIINCTQDPALEAYVTEMGIAIFALAFRCDDASAAHSELVKRGAWDASNRSGPMEVNIPGVESIGGTLIYLIDQLREDLSIYDIDFKSLPEEKTAPQKAQLSSFKGFTIQVDSGRKEACLTFFEKVFGFAKTEQGALKLPGKDTLILDLVEAPLTDHDNEFFSSLSFHAVAGSPLTGQQIQGAHCAFDIEVA